MKYILFIIPYCISLGLLAQTKTKSQPKPPSTTSSDCYKEWYLLFKERGALPIPDGIQDVIITLRNNDISVCFFGKIEVKDGKLNSKLQVQKVDGTYEEFDKKVSAVYQNSEGVLKPELREISNGSTSSLELTDGEMIKLFFYKSLNDVPKANKKAASPNTLIKK